MASRWFIVLKVCSFCSNLEVQETSRDRPKSAPYPRLKNNKKTSKCQVFPFTVLENRTLFEKKISKTLHTQKNGRGARETLTMPKN